MNRKNAMYLALFSAISGTAAAAPPTEMDAAPVTNAPQAAKLGAATLQSASLRGGVLPTRVVQLAAPTSAEIGRVRERRIAQVKQGQPLQIGFSRAVAQPTVNLSRLDWQMARAWPASKSAPHRRHRCVHR
ncbi:peptidase [Xanthomonas citri pv. malvacearum]|nr:peptidase [Xanthomonas citri pv. malvacearum]